MARAKREPVKQEKVFYSTQVKQTVMVPVRDSDGKPVVRKDRFGNEMLNGTEPWYVLKPMLFDTVSAKAGATLSMLTTTDEYLIEHMEKLAADPSTNVMTEETYQNSRNPEAFQKAMALDVAQQKIQNQNATIQEMQDRIKALEAKNTGKDTVKTE